MKDITFESFKTEMDGWIKDFEGRISPIKDMSLILEENTENIDHNYELLHDMKDEIAKLKEEVSALRTIQLLSLRAELRKVNKENLIE